MANTIKTANVIVETGELISTLTELEISSRWICWLDEDETFIHSKGSRAYEVALGKDTGACRFPTDFNEKAKVAMEKFHENGLIITDLGSIYFMAATFTQFYRGYRYWRSNPILETIQSHYMRRSLPNKIKLDLNRLSLFYLESGINLKVKDLFILLSSKMSNINHESFVFHSLERFKNAHMKQVLLEIASLQTLFLLLFGSQLTLIILLILFISTQQNRGKHFSFRQTFYMSNFDSNKAL